MGLLIFSAPEQKVRVRRNPHTYNDMSSSVEKTIVFFPCIDAWMNRDGRVAIVACDVGTERK